MPGQGRAGEPCPDGGGGGADGGGGAGDGGVPGHWGHQGHLGPAPEISSCQHSGVLSVSSWQMRYIGFIYQFS